MTANQIWLEITLIALETLSGIPTLQENMMSRMKRMKHTIPQMHVNVTLPELLHFQLFNRSINPLSIKQ